MSGAGSLASSEMETQLHGDVTHLAHEREKDRCT